MYSIGFKYEIIVIDNNSIDKSREIIKSFGAKITSYFLSFNSGFSFANNYGIHRASGEYILLLNPDTNLQDNAIIKMINYLEFNTSVGAIGPLFIDSNGREYLSYSFFPNIKQQILETYFFKKWLNKLERTKSQESSLIKKKPFTVDWLSGACLFFQRSTFNQIGGLNEQYHIYYEDVDWCKKINKIDREIHCVPSISVVHHGSIGAKSNYFILVLNRYRSKLIYAKEHFSYLQYISLRIILIPGLLIRLVGAPIKFYNNPKEIRERILAYCCAIGLCIGINKISSRYNNFI